VPFFVVKKGRAKITASSNLPGAPMPAPGINQTKYPHVVELAVGKDGLDVPRPSSNSLAEQSLMCGISCCAIGWDARSKRETGAC